MKLHEHILTQAIQNNDVTKAISIINVSSPIELSFIDNMERSFLMQAIILRRIKIASLLLEKLQCLNFIILKKDLTGKSIISYAAELNEVNFLEKLLDLCDRFDSKIWLEKDKQGQTPLHLACKAGSAKSIDVLVNRIVSSELHCVNVLNVTDHQGNSPLHIMCVNASKFKQEDMIRFINHGASLQVVNNDNKIPADLLPLDLIHLANNANLTSQNNLSQLPPRPYERLSYNRQQLNDLINTVNGMIATIPSRPSTLFRSLAIALPIMNSAIFIPLGLFLVKLELHALKQSGGGTGDAAYAVGAMLAGPLGCFIAGTFGSGVMARSLWKKKTKIKPEHWQGLPEIIGNPFIKALDTVEAIKQRIPEETTANLKSACDHLSHPVLPSNALVDLQKLSDSLTTIRSSLNQTSSVFFSPTASFDSKLPEAPEKEATERHYLLNC